jgi:hypothetical protein
LGIKHDCPFPVDRDWNRGGVAAIPISQRSGAGTGPVDDLQLGELSQTLFGKLGAYAGLLGTAKRNMRGYVQMLVDPDRAGLIFRATFDPLYLITYHVLG